MSEPLNDADRDSQKPASSSVDCVQDGLPLPNQPNSKEKPSHNPSLETDSTNTLPPKSLENQKDRAGTESLPWHAWFSRNGNATKPEPPKPPDSMQQPIPNEPESLTRRRNSDPSAASSNAAQETLPRSWLGLWAARSLKTELADGGTVAAASIDKPLSSSVPVTPKTEDVPIVSNTQSSTSKAPGWAFWSREAPRDTTSDTSQANKGELVLADSPDQAAATSPFLKSSQNTSAKKPVSMESTQNSSSSRAATAQISSKTPPVATGKPSKTTGTSKTNSLDEDKTSKNLLLPSMASTYHPAPRLSLLQSLSRWWQDDRSSGGNRVKILHNPPRIKRALAIVSTPIIYKDQS